MFNPSFSSLPGIDTFPSVVAMIVVFPEEEGPNSFDKSTVMVSTVPVSDSSTFFMIDSPCVQRSGEIDEGQEGQRADHIWNHATIEDDFQGNDAGDGGVPGLVFLVNKFIGQDDDRAGEGDDATATGPGVDAAEDKVHREKAAPG